MTSLPDGPPRPNAISATAAALLLLALAFFGVARSTGAGWVVVLLCGLVAALAVGALWPLVALVRATVSASGPADATVGEPLVLVVGVRGGGLFQLRTIVPSGDWIGAVGGTTGTILVVPRRRAVETAVVLEVSSGGPLGLFRWRRAYQVALTRPIEVGPAPAAVNLGDVLLPGVEGADASPRHRLGHDAVRSVREYVAGDPFRLVHWPATARTGELMVRETEAPDAPHLVLVVDLGTGGEVGERVASRAAGLGQAALRAGLPLTIVTFEASGPKSGQVGTAVEVGRRLARAIPGAPSPSALPAGAVTVSVSAP